MPDVQCYYPGFILGDREGKKVTYSVLRLNDILRSSFSTPQVPVIFSYGGKFLEDNAKTENELVTKDGVLAEEAINHLSGCDQLFLGGLDDGLQSTILARIIEFIHYFKEEDTTSHVVTYGNLENGKCLFMSANNKDEYGELRPEPAFLAYAMMLEYLGEKSQTELVRKAVRANMEDPDYNNKTLEQLTEQACEFLKSKL